MRTAQRTTRGTAPSQALIREWDRKLKASGFTDVEVVGGRRSEIYLQGSLRYIAGQYNTATDEYFTRCRTSAVHGQFTNWLEQDVWTMYSEGKSYRDIVKLATDLWTLPPTPKASSGRLTLMRVYRMVNQLKERFKIVGGTK